MGIIRIIILAGLTLIPMIGVLNFSDSYAEDEIALQELIGIWWTHDADQVPWAIQFNRDGTFRTAHTYLRLEKRPIDEGQFKLDGSTLTLISNTDCAGSCKGMKGLYKVEFTKYGQLFFERAKGPVFGKKRGMYFALDQSFALKVNIKACQHTLVSTVEMYY